MNLPITVVAGLDRAAAQGAAHQLLGAGQRSRLVQHCLDQIGVGLVSRTITSGSGAVDSALIDLAHGCVSCTLREDVLPTLRRLAADPGVDSVVLLLPEAVEPAGFLDAFAFVPDERGATAAQVCRIRAVVTVVDPPQLLPRLSGDERLADRGQEIGPGDDRSVGEVLIAGVEAADVIIAPRATAAEASLLSLLNGEARICDRAPGRLRSTFDFQRCLARTSPAHVDHPAVDGVGEDAWRVHWRSGRPLHPRRLYEALDGIAEIALRGRGHLRLATRPADVVEWDSIGARLRLGAPDIDIDAAASHLCFVGVSDRWHQIGDRLAGAELTDAEMAAPPTAWAAVEDPFDEIWTAEPDDAEAGR